MFKKAKHIHFVGIGGIGMSGIAELLLNLEFQITGSDINQSQNIERLEAIGINISLYNNFLFILNNPTESSDFPICLKAL